MNAQQLHNSILQEAIEGRLVPQDPNDEPASVLLNRIREEKKRLVKEGKLKKKDLVETHISEDEKPFEIPESWEWVRIGSIFSMQAGKNVTAADIKAEKSEKFPYQCYGGNGIRGYVAKYNTTGCFPLVGRQGALCGCVAWASGKFYATEHAVVASGKENTNQRFLFYLFQQANLNQYKSQGAQPGLSVAKLNELLFRIPPLSEQQRIVSILDTFEASISNLEAQLEQRQKQYEYYRNQLLTFE